MRDNIISVPKHDTYHQQVRHALEKDGWTIIADPLRAIIGSDTMLVDLAAERLLAAERGTERIAVEIKGYNDTNNINGFHNVVGQYINYRLALSLTHPDHVLHLAIPEEIYRTFFQRKFAQMALKANDIRLIVYNVQNEVIVHDTD
jgi:hypothetical protein